MDGSGNLKHRNLRTYDITLLEGSPYRRLVKRDDQPLPPAEEKQQQDNLQISIEQRAAKRRPEQRRQRIADWDRKRTGRGWPISKSVSLALSISEWWATMSSMALRCGL